jgi:hypothetical protein
MRHLPRHSLPPQPSSALLPFLLLAGLLVVVLLAGEGCGDKPLENPNVKKFVEQTRRDFHRLDTRLAPLLGQALPRRKVDRALERFFNDPGALEGRKNLGIAVLDRNVTYLAGRKISENRSGPEPIQTRLTDFSYLGDLFESARSGITHRPLYFQDREIFTACSTIGGDDPPEGYACLFYDAAAFTRMWGFGKETFTQIDFSR